MSPVVGKRVDDPPGLFAPGEYGRINGQWHGRAPADAGDVFGFGCNLSGHEVVEHEDGTITVSPSILIRRHDGKSWHGFLERGVWSEC